MHMTHSLVRVLALLVLVPGLVSAVAEAQDSPRRGCFAGKPLPRCNWFMLTEWSVLARANTGARERKMFNGTLGVMVNRSPRTALGVEFIGMVPIDDAQLAVGARYRRWLSPTSSVDVTAGTTLIGDVSPYGGELSLPSPMVLVRLQHRDLIGVVFRGDIQRSGSIAQARVAVGVQLGGWPGVVGMLLTARAAFAEFAEYY